MTFGSNCGDIARLVRCLWTPATDSCTFPSTSHIMRSAFVAPYRWVIYLDCATPSLSPSPHIEADHYGRRRCHDKRGCGAAAKHGALALSLAHDEECQEEMPRRTRAEDVLPSKASLCLRICRIRKCEWHDYKKLLYRFRFGYSTFLAPAYTQNGFCPIQCAK